MLARWTELLPVFLFRRLAARHCERIGPQNGIWLDARPGLLIRDHATINDAVDAAIEYEVVDPPPGSDLSPIRRRKP